MIIGFLGKGGSGKTTLATLYTKYLLDKKNFTHMSEVFENGNHVMALDNDHNMDFKFNLAGEKADSETIKNWMGQSLSDIFEEIAITSTKDIGNIEEDYMFSLSPLDKITDKYSKIINIKIGDDENENVDLRLMVAGPHTPEMMYGNMCSHGLTTPLKVYLPFLKLEDNQYVIVDEKAGTDGVGTGVTTGFNIAVVVAEATTHGVKAAKQIIDMLKFYKTPFVVAVNKLKNDQDESVYDQEFVDLGCDLVLHFKLDLGTIDLKSNTEYKKEFRKMYDYTLKLNDDRKERTKDKVKKQKEFNQNKVK